MGIDHQWALPIPALLHEIWFAYNLMAYLEYF